MEEEILRLAWELDRFAADYDPYEYRDCVEDPAQNAAEYAELIQEGNIDGIADWLRQIISDSEEKTEEIGTAEKLLRKTEGRMNMKVLLVEPLEKPCVAEIGKDLKNLQKTVGGLIQEILPWEDPVALVCNDEGKINGLPLNRLLRDESGTVFDIIAGTFFICGIDDEAGDYTDIPEYLIEKYSRMFALTEIIL